MNQTDTTDGPLAVDVLIVGGGVQGLTLLRTATDRGYAAALVTNAALGSGQTLHSHGFLNSGYTAPDPALRRSLEEDWLPFLDEHGVERYGADRFFGVLPPDTFEILGDALTASDYPFEEVDADALPAGFRAGLPEDDPVVVVRVEEHRVPKRGLVRALSDGLEDRIVRGEVTRVRFTADGDDGTVGASAVAVEPHATGGTVTVEPSFVVAATGTGTEQFVTSTIDDASFDRAAGEAAGLLRDSIADQLDRITYERAHMICLRGSTDVLPGVGVFLGGRGLTLVSADVDANHDRVDDQRRTWYVTPRTPVAEPLGAVPESHLGAPDPAAVARGVEVLLGAYPPLQEHLDEVEFGVYAGIKQNVDDSRVTRLCEPLEGVPNVVLALPSVIGSAWLTARETVDIVEAEVDPSGARRLPVPGDGVGVGEVTERTDDFEWLSWEAFSEEFPGIDA